MRVLLQSTHVSLDMTRMPTQSRSPDRRYRVTLGQFLALEHILVRAENRAREEWQQFLAKRHMHQLPTVDVKQYWHRRFHNDSANKWLRTMVATLFQTAGRRGIHVDCNL